MTVEIVLFPDNDNYIKITGLYDRTTGNWINSGTVTGSVRDVAKAVLSPAVDLTFSYLAGTNGNWEAFIPDTDTLPLGRHFLFLEVNAGANKVGHWEIPVNIQTRERAAS